jgi:hypothetical protein
MISRRGFFKGFAAAAGTVILVPSTIAYFLPPLGGWSGHLRIRKARQWDIYQDTIAVRYDAVWTGAEGEKQYSVHMEGWGNDDIEACKDRVARETLERIMRQQNGIVNLSEHFKLQLLPPYVWSAWV